MPEKLLRPEEAARILQVTPQTLIRWSNEGIIKYVRTPGGHRRYPQSELHTMRKDNSTNELSNELSNESENGNRRRICYCRVSTMSQKEDLDRQQQFFRRKYPNYEIISDYGSGLNFKRKGFQTILDAGIGGHIEEIVVTHKDRLCRFGFELVERIIEKHSHGKIVVLNHQKTSPQQELVNDLISIITVFFNRIYGLRSGKIQKEITLQTQLENSKNENISDESGENTITNNDGTISLVL